jgi:hypothetical protein
VAEWRAYYDLEPWGEDRADVRAAIQGARVVQALTGQDQDLEAFMPSFEPDDETLEAAAAMSNLERLAHALGAEVE